MSRRTSESARNFRWNHLPYGVWICADGREVLFNRHYQPLWQRRNGICSPAENEWVTFDKSEWFYDDGTVSSKPRFIRNLTDILNDFQRGDDVRGRRA